jgi:hypothetical protein
VIVHPSRHAVKRSLAGARGTLVVVAALIVAVAPVHFGISSLAACIGLVVPVAVMVGEIAGGDETGYFCRTGAPSACR